MVEKGKKKQPAIKTLEDKGTKVDLVDFGDGRQAFFFRTEEFKGISIGAFRLGWTNKYDVVSPTMLTNEQLTFVSGTISTVTGSTVSPTDLEVHTAAKDISSSMTVRYQTAEKKEDKK